QKKGSPLATEYAAAVQRAEANARVLSKAGDYPLLGGGDVNLYSLFVERAQGLVKPQGVVALLTPSGIAADKGASVFFRSIATTRRLAGLFDFENRKGLFPDVDSRFKFCTLLFGGAARRFDVTRCAFYLHGLDELAAPGRQLEMTADDFALMNPNTGAAPIFRAQRDLEITRAVYRRHPVLVRHGEVTESLGRLPDQRAWPVTYTTLFHMTNDSGRFQNAESLRKQGFGPSELGRWRRGDEEALPLYEGKMVQMFDHRAADVTVNAENLHRAAQPSPIRNAEKVDPARLPAPQYWVVDEADGLLGREWALGFKEITAPTNMRTMISAMLPNAAFGNKLPLLLIPDVDSASAARMAALLCANLNALAFDFVLRRKLQGQTINWFILEQLSVIAAATFDSPLSAPFAARMRETGLMNGHHPSPTVADFVIPQVLALSYTAHDLAPFARDLGYVDAQGQVLPPFTWDDEDRRRRLAALDALFFHLYGLGEDDAAYVMDTFPIVRQQDEATFGRYRTKDDVLALLRLMPAPAG
ncbi:MAG: hypothetical protein Q8K45_13050, partial [Rubrivivax sp.]|nr:hypothetical protein [Rubrivivax sp.]